MDASSHPAPSAPRKSTSAKPRVLAYPYPPPEPEDVEWFRQRRRKEITRRAFVVGGIAAGVGLAVLPFLPWGGDKPDAKLLLDPNIAKADPQLLLQLCTLYYQHPQPQIREIVAAQLSTLEQFPASKPLLWAMTRADPLPSIRQKAIQSLVCHAAPSDHAAIVAHYKATPEHRGAIDNAAAMMGLSSLQAAITAAMR